MIKAVDFFCGAGGLTRGLLDAGIEVILGIDSCHEYRKTYETNNPPAAFLCQDIREISFGQIRTHIGHVDRQNLLFAACAPCQPFSKQRTTTRAADQRTLLWCFARFVEHFKPEYVLVENVPGIARVGGLSTYRRFLSMLEKHGYSYDAANIDAKEYGVPQTRRRHIVLARRSAPIRIPAPTYGHGQEPYRTVRQAISHLPPIPAGYAHPSFPNHRASALSEGNLERIRKTPHDGGNRLDWPDGLVLDCHRGNYGGHTDVYGRMWWDRPAPALTCKCHSLSNGRYGHPEQDRAISLREAAALQTFPDDFLFFGSSKASIGNQIGNAVPVMLATAMARALTS